MTTLTEVRNFLSGINYINSGGCGIAALAMIRWIRKNLNKEIDNIYFEHCSYCDNKNDNKKYIKNGVGTISAPTHVYISINKKIMDVKTIVKSRNIDGAICFKSEDILLAAINNIKSWNSRFKRRSGIKMIEKHLGITMSDVNKY